MQPRMRRTMILPVLAAVLACAFAATSPRAQEPERGRGRMQMKMEMMASPITKAVAVLHATKSGGEAGGVITFTKVANGVHIAGEIKGLTPGTHGFHIHEFGDCSTPDAMSAGGHFNPNKTPHAGPSTAARHVGDLGNIEADSKGVAKVDVTEPHLLFFGPTSIIGRGLIVHKDADDLKTQPTGNAGGRVACGVIGVAKAN